jgi:hypothetical protein
VQGVEYPSGIKEIEGTGRSPLQENAAILLTSCESWGDDLERHRGIDPVSPVRIRHLMIPSLDIGLTGVLPDASSYEWCVMNEVKISPLAEKIPDIGGSFARASSNATSRLCAHGQSVAQAIGEWNTEASHFLSRRAARSTETMQSLVKCQNFVDICAVQAQWLRDAVDDYLKQTSKIIELNHRFLSDLLESVPKYDGQPSGTAAHRQ